jgi:predicted nucleotidyltransferase
MIGFVCMDLSRPYLALTSRVDGAVLQGLHRTTASLTGRQVARLAGASQPAVQAALSRFVEHGLVLASEAGKAYLYVLNRDHVAIPAVDAMLGMRAAVIERIRSMVKGWTLPALHVSVFGSMARGDGGTESDIDILIVRADGIDMENEMWRRQVSDLENAINRWTGNRAAPVEVDLNDVLEMARQKRRLIGDIRRDGIFVAGWPLEGLISGSGIGPKGEE